MREWTPEAIARVLEAARYELGNITREEARRKALVDKGVCPDSGYTIKRCKRTICDCFDYEDKYGVSQR